MGGTEGGRVVAGVASVPRSAVGQALEVRAGEQGGVPPSVDVVAVSLDIEQRILVDDAAGTQNCPGDKMKLYVALEEDRSAHKRACRHNHPQASTAFWMATVFIALPSPTAP